MILVQKKLFVDDGGYATIHHIRSKLRKLKSQHSNISMAVIDYLQLMSGNRGKEGRQQEISEISRGLKQLARELEIPILALSQLNRGLESRGELKTDVKVIWRESGCLAGDTLVVEFLNLEKSFKLGAMWSKTKRGHFGPWTDGTLWDQKF